LHTRWIARLKCLKLLIKAEKAAKTKFAFIYISRSYCVHGYYAWKSYALTGSKLGAQHK